MGVLVVCGLLCVVLAVRFVHVQMPSGSTLVRASEAHLWQGHTVMWVGSGAQKQLLRSGDTLGVRCHGITAACSGVWPVACARPGWKVGGLGLGSVCSA